MDNDSLPVPLNQPIKVEGGKHDLECLEMDRSSKAQQKEMN
jgi:hypothetical protein